MGVDGLEPGLWDDQLVTGWVILLVVVNIDLLLEMVCVTVTTPVTRVSATTVTGGKLSPSFPSGTPDESCLTTCRRDAIGRLFDMTAEVVAVAVVKEVIVVVVKAIDVGDKGVPGEECGGWCAGLQLGL